MEAATATLVMGGIQKAAIAQGRIEAEAVRKYLEWLKNNKPQRGRPRTSRTIDARIVEIKAKLSSGCCTVMEELRLVQEQIDLAVELEALIMAVDATTVEAGFIMHAAGYGARKKISYKAWLVVGVPAAVLKRAGISRK